MTFINKVKLRHLVFYKKVKVIVVRLTIYILYL